MLLIEVPRLGAPHDAQHGANSAKPCGTMFNKTYTHSLAEIIALTTTGNAHLSYHISIQTRGANPAGFKKSMTSVL